MKHNNHKQLLAGMGILLVLTLLFGMAMIPRQADTPSAEGFDLTVDSTSKSGPPGTSVTYAFSINNKTLTSNTYTITCDGISEPCPSPVTIDPDTTGTFNVLVTVPAGAISGDTFSTYVFVYDQSSDEYESITLTTIAYIPPSPTNTAEPYRRPLIGVESYSAGDQPITPGNDFTLTLKLRNSGPTLAGSVVVAFESSDFLPLETGGVRHIAELGAGSTVSITQPMRANFSMWGYDSGTIQVNVSYSDVNGTQYSETFTLTINLKTPVYTAPTPTPTPNPDASAQLVVNSYTTDIEPLQPGSLFQLTLVINNMGLDDARKVTMVLGGGVESVQPGTDGSTSGGGGMSGGSADLTHFGPLGSSNIIFLDSISAGATLQTSVQLIVNVTTTPGAYPFKISFVYEDAEGKRVVDDQVITLLVYQLPMVEVGFYRDPGVLFAGQPAMLPLQITNLGKTTAVLGNMVVTSANAEITENSLLVGALEPGGYYTMDATAWPMVEGPMTITVTVNYTDDFNQSRTIEQTFELVVEPMPVFEPPAEGEFVDPSQGGMEPGQPETFFQKVWRFILGLLGLDSGTSQPDEMMMPVEEEMYIEPIPGGKGG
ncbi:MAG: hypothetical protein HPY85_01325 [Anaerolineae bacterium]|nr:hypothetical protein [Anaerolineae bacterium]